MELTMDDTEKRKLVIQHAQFTAAAAAGDAEAKNKMETIQAKLNLTTQEIMKLAIKEYNRDY
jgi:hypothetical protein